MATATAAKPTTDQHIAALKAMTTRTDAAAYLTGVKGNDLNALVRATGNVSLLRAPVAYRREAVVEAYVGVHINSVTIRKL